MFGVLQAAEAANGSGYNRTSQLWENHHHYHCIQGIIKIIICCISQLSFTFQAITKLQKKLKTYPVNPKSMSRQHLLGYMDHLNQWNDGVLTSYSLQVSSEAEGMNSLWIEKGEGFERF